MSSTRWAWLVITRTCASFAMKSLVLPFLILFLSICAQQVLGVLNYERDALVKHANWQDSRPPRVRVRGSSGPQELYFPQQLDNFNYFEGRTWLQRYFLIGMLYVSVCYLYNTCIIVVRVHECIRTNETRGVLINTLKRKSMFMLHRCMAFVQFILLSKSTS